MDRLMYPTTNVREELTEGPAPWSTGLAVDHFNKDFKKGFVAMQVRSRATPCKHHGGSGVVIFISANRQD
jgi:hypothetical protein